jgi:hypothetical protein
MATFSQGFLANLGRPAMGESLFGLGRAIGGLPGQAQDRKKREQFNQLMQQGQAAMASGDAAKLAQVGQQLTSAGYVREGQALTQASISASAKQKAQAEQMGQQRTSAQMLMTELQDYANNPQLPQPVRQQAGNLLRAAAQAGDRATLLEPRVAQLRNLASQAGKPQVVSAGGALVSPTGEELYRAPFKPEKQGAPKVNIIKPSKEDPNFRIFNERGELVNTIPVQPQGRTVEEVEMDNERIAQIVRIKGDIKDLMDPEGEYYEEWTTSGVLGQILGNWMGGTTAYDRRALIDSVKASLGLEAIAKLKKASATGATGLGQVSNLELNALQSEVATLNIGQSMDAQMDSLEKIFGYLDRVQKIASGIVPVEAIDWNSPEYKAAGYGRDPVTGVVMYAPQGSSGPAYKLVDGSFKKLDI